MMKYQRHTPTLLALALATSLYGPAAMAQAQEPSSVDDANEQATDLDAVTVTGYRYAIEKSLEQKRNANAVVDVITAEDVSKFPDKNVADALQRVPGVIIQRDGGEGHRVQVRGLQPDLTLTQLNGNYIASSETNDEASRSFNYMLMPAHLLGSAELYKTPEARIDEGGIGGTVILHSRRPLDMEPNSGFVSAEGTYSDTSKTTDPQLSAMYSWHSEDNRFGFLVNATKQKRTNRSIGASTENWIWYSDNNVDGTRRHPAVDVNGQPLTGVATWWGGSGFNDQHNPYTGPFIPCDNENPAVGSNRCVPPGAESHYSGFFMPTSVNFGIHEEERERTGTQLTFQFRPTDDLTLTANYFRFDLQGDYVFNQLKIPEWNLARINWDGNWPGGRLLNGLTFDPSGTIVTGAEYEKIAGKQYYCSEAEAAAGGQAPGGWGPDDCTVPTPQLTGTYSREKTKSETFDIGMEWNAGDLLRISAKGGRTKSSGGPSMNFRMSAKPRRFVDGAWQAGNTYSAWDLSGTPTATFSPDLQEMLMSGIAEIDIGSTDSSWMETDLSQDYFQIDVTRLFETGWLESLQFGTKFRDGKVHRNTGNTYWVCQGEDPTDYDKRYQTGCDPEAGIAQSGFFLSRPITNIPGGFNANVFPGINYPAYIDYLNSRYGGAQRRQEPDFIYDVSEEIHAGYLQANFRTDRLRGNLGVRVVRTNQKAQSTDSVERFLYLLEKDASGNLLPCDANNPPPGRQCQGGYVWADAREKTFALASLDKSYTDVLPSFNIAWDITYDLVLRGAASKTIARPAFSNIARPGGLQFYTEEYSNDRGVIGGSVNPGWHGSGSNKDLKPFEATQYDLGLEWYYQPGAVVGVGLFHKDVKNFTVPAVFDYDLDIEGVPVTVQNFSTVVNGRDGVSQGVEVFAQHSFDFGLGLQANYTYNKTNEAAVVLPDGREIGKSPLIGSAKTQANFTVFYETGKYLARASYNRRGEVVGALHNGQNLYTEPYQQIDLNVGYNILENLTLTGSVLNLTKEESRTHLGNDTKARLWSNNYSGRIYYLGLTYKF